ncbi:MAG TPA: ATP-binding protein [Nocardioides sp.]|nr:ATP-binding protein [Nocardioides sp.]
MSIQIVMMVPPEAASVSLARHTLTETMRLARVAPDCIQEAEVALSEACTQVWHDLADGKGLEVLINVGDRELTMHVLESGSGYPEHDQGTFLAEVSSQNSRGMLLMKEFADRTSIHEKGGGNSIHLTKQLTWIGESLPSG